MADGRPSAAPALGGPTAAPRSAPPGRRGSQESSVLAGRGLGFVPLGCQRGQRAESRVSAPRPPRWGQSPDTPTRPSRLLPLGRAGPGPSSTWRAPWPTPPRRREVVLEHVGRRVSRTVRGGNWPPSWCWLHVNEGHPPAPSWPQQGEPRARWWWWCARGGGRRGEAGRVGT